MRLGVASRLSPGPPRQQPRGGNGLARPFANRDQERKDDGPNRRCSAGPRQHRIWMTNLGCGSDVRFSVLDFARWPTSEAHPRWYAMHPAHIANFGTRPQAVLRYHAARTAGPKLYRPFARPRRAACARPMRCFLFGSVAIGNDSWRSALLPLAKPAMRTVLGLSLSPRFVQKNVPKRSPALAAARSSQPHSLSYSASC